MSGKTLVEVAVVGGGVCGLFCGLVLAEHDVKVAIFEEHPSIGKPSHCAGHLSIKNLEQLGFYPLPKGILENEYKGAFFYSPTGNSFKVEFDSPVTCSVNRESFDKFVAELALKAGAKVHLKTYVKSLVIRNRQVKGINVNYDGKLKHVNVKIVVDAEGVSSRILRQVGLQTLNRSMVVNGVSAETERVKNLNEDFIEVYFGNAYAPGFYAWIMPRKDGTAKIGLATKQGNPKQFLDKFKQKHPVASKKLDGAKIVQKTFHPITLGGFIPQTFSEGFIVVGDAASQVKPTTGGGVILGMNCAKIAAETVHKALKKRDFSAKVLSEYQRRCRKLMGFDMRVMFWMRKIFDRLSDNQIDKLVLKCQSLGLSETLGKVQEIDFQGRSIAKIAWQPSIISFGLYLIFEALFGQKPFN